LNCRFCLYRQVYTEERITQTFTQEIEKYLCRRYPEPLEVDGKGCGERVEKRGAK